MEILETLPHATLRHREQAKKTLLSSVHCLRVICQIWHQILVVITNIIKRGIRELGIVIESVREKLTRPSMNGGAI